VQPKIPIYGYNDYSFTKIARGKGIVQGLLVLNFVFPGYLNTVIENPRNGFVPKLYNYKLQGRRDSEDRAVGQGVTEQLRTELPGNSTTEEKQARAEFIAGILTQNNRNSREAVSDALYGFFSDEELVADTGTNANQSPLLSENLTDIGNYLDVYYQDPENVTWFTRFENVHITDVSQQISQAGAEGSSEPLYEIYQWMAKNKIHRTIR
jgi:hypothetical protein